MILDKPESFKTGGRTEKKVKAKAKAIIAFDYSPCPTNHTNPYPYLCHSHNALSRDTL